ncbi:MAG: DNA-binding protein [Candidatus Wildermuthbacteria bacterium]|nr:DNA-binding protein [Candidatus Wildermuthbacteria bacterium]
MKLILQDKSKYVLRADVGEEVIESLAKFCRQENIDAAKFFAIGAAKELKLGWYDVDAKEYTWKEFSEKLEIVSLLGNVSWKENEIIVHAHGSFSNQQMQLVGGHVARLLVGGACEIVLEKLEGRIEKVYDEETGLYLMQ